MTESLVIDFLRIHQCWNTGKKMEKTEERGTVSCFYCLTQHSSIPLFQFFYGSVLQLVIFIKFFPVCADDMNRYALN
jgi:hypothetical protein